MAIIRREPGDIFRNEFDNLFAEMENRFQSLLPSFPAYSQRNRERYPVPGGGFTIDVQEKEKEIIATADLPGCMKEDVKIRLIRPNLLQISCERTEDTEDEGKDYFIRERFFGSVNRSVPLPADVTEDGAKAVFENGVLSITFNKSETRAGGEIPIS